jgi:hypothetical protein
MKVLLINGSPHEKGCTYTALCEVAGDFRARRVIPNAPGAEKCVVRQLVFATFPIPGMKAEFPQGCSFFPSHVL